MTNDKQLSSVGLCAARGARSKCPRATEPPVAGADPKATLEVRSPPKSHQAPTSHPSTPTIVHLQPLTNTISNILVGIHCILIVCFPVSNILSSFPPPRCPVLFSLFSCCVFWFAVDRTVNIPAKNELSTFKALSAVAVIFACSVLALVYLYSKFPDLEEYAYMFSYYAVFYFYAFDERFVSFVSEKKRNILKYLWILKTLNN